MEQSKSNLVYELSNSLNLYFQNKDYGEDVKNIEIGLLMTFSKEGYEDWYKPKRMSYIKYKKSKHKLTGEVIEIEKTLKYEIKFTDQQLAKYVGGENQFSKDILITEIKNSVSNLNELPKDVKDFELEVFKHDLDSFFNITI